MVAVAAGLALAAYPRSKPLRLRSPSDARHGSPRPAEASPPLPIGVAPVRTWRVDSGAAFELYSNGLRIDTTYAVGGDPRRYRVFTVGKGMGPRSTTGRSASFTTPRRATSGPWRSRSTRSCATRARTSSATSGRTRSTHYLIDRFGQVFRVVEEKDKANHAGMSVWSAGDDVYST